MFHIILLIDFGYPFTVITKKIDMKKLTQIAKGTTSTAKGMVIGEKCPRDEVPDIKKKGPMLSPEEKKKAPSKSKSTPSRTTSKVAARTTALG